MPEIEETEFDEEVYTKELEAKVKEINTYLDEQYTKMSEYTLKEITTLHRKYCKLKDTPEAKSCEREFTHAFLAVLEIDQDQNRRRRFSVEFEVEEIPVEKDDGHVHEPAPEIPKKKKA